MAGKHREMYFFTEKYIGKDKNHREIIRSWKNTLNYINRFSISEEDGFDIAGIFTMTNSSQLTKSIKRKSKRSKNFLNKELAKTYPSRAEILRHLSEASGIVHVFISGMKLYRDHRLRKKGSYVELNKIIRHCISNVQKENVELLRVTVMECRVSEKIRTSRGFKINSSDVGALYKKQNESVMSLNNDLDSFYLQCLDNSVKNGVIQFFHAQQLTPDEFKIFQIVYEKWLQARISTAHRRNHSKFTKILRRLSSTDDAEPFKKTDLDSELRKAKNIFEQNVTRLNDRHKLVLDSSANQDFKLYIGFRATIEIPLDQGINNDNNGWLTELIFSLESKLIHSQLWQCGRFQTESEREFKRQYKSFKGCLQSFH